MRKISITSTSKYLFFLIYFMTASFLEKQFCDHDNYFALKLKERHLYIKYAKNKRHDS